MAEPPPPLHPSLPTVTAGCSISSSSLSTTAIPVSTVAIGGGAGPQAINTTGPLVSLPPEGGREYRKGNWTLHETVILIAAKKKDEERRLRGGDKDKSRTAELRWKWIENYCYLNGCHRNQNQCNDKWDNLLRDYKKVRDYELRLQQTAAAAGGGALQAQTQSHSYWQLEKHERKEKGLPSNLLFQVYEALHEVVDKRYPLRSPTASSACPLPPPLPHPVPPAQLPSAHLLHEYHPQQQQQQIVSAPLLPYHQHQAHTQSQPQPQPQLHPSFVPNLPPEIKPYGHHQQAVHHAASPEPSDSSQSHGSEIPQSPAKRRKFEKGTSVSAGAEATGAGASTVEGLGAAVLRSTAELSQTLLACEERKDKRHKELLSVEEKKLVLENTKAEISREGIAGLINAINNLASAVISLASDRNLTSS